MLELKNICKTYKPKKGPAVAALKNISIKFDEKGMVFILGKSGCGKSTLLNVIGGLDKFDSGEIFIKGKSSREFSAQDFDSYRNTFIGFIFQEYNILSEFNIEKNIALALELQGKKATNEEVQKLLDQVDLKGQGKRKTNELSGGQKQRVAIARALIKDPEIIIADEPTGALDSATGKQVFDTLKKLSKEKLVIIVSHDREYAEIYADRIVEMKDGVVVSDETKRQIPPTPLTGALDLISEDLLHIKAGQKLGEKELQAIGNYVNSTQEEIFISLGGKTNKKLKEFSKISDNGKAETFTATQESDFKKTSYNKDELKLIKSRLKFKDSLKMGASALKHKVGKLVFTILLSFVAFAMFGIVDTMASFNRAQSVYSTISQTQQKSISITKQLKGEWINTFDVFSFEDKSKLEKDYDTKIYPVFNRGISLGYSYVSDEYLILDNFVSSSRNPLTAPVFGGFCQLDNATLEELDFKLVGGTLPTAINEVCITKSVYDGIAKLNPSKITKISDLLGETCRAHEGYFKIVGVVDTYDDFSKYDSITEEQLERDYNTSQKILAERGFGFSSVLFASKDYIDSLADRGINFDYSIQFGDETGGYSFNSDEVYTSKEFYEQFKSAYVYDTPEQCKENFAYEFSCLKSGKTIDGIIEGTAIGKGEIIVPEVYFNEDKSILQSKIESGSLKVSIITEDDELTMKVVGLNRSNRCIVSNVDYEKYFHIIGFDYGIVKFTKDISSYQSLIKRCETFDKNGVKFTIQNSSTQTLDQFGSMIESMSQVFLYIGIGFAVFSSLLLMNFISTSINYKKREIGILRALGARGSDVFGIFFKESVIISLINFALATVATLVAAFFINQSVMSELGINFVLLSVGIRQILLILFVSLLSAFLASLIPVTKISRKKPIEAIRTA